MVGENQSSVTLPSGIVERLELFLKTKKASDLGLTSRPQVVIMLLRDFLKENLSEELEQNKESKIELVGTIGNKIILEDSIQGTITVIIDKENRLMCYSCKEDQHDNKYVRFCLKNENLWSFLKKNKVKLVEVRRKDKDVD